MANITRLGFVRHLRSAANVHALHFRKGEKVRSGRGLSFWFLPLSSNLMEVPCDDRDQPFLFHARTSDFQDITVQGTLTYRLVDPERAAERIDFSIDSSTGRYLNLPHEQISELLTQTVQQIAWEYLAAQPLRSILGEGIDRLRERIRSELVGDATLEAIGLELGSVRITDVAPTAELEKALEAPARESIQQSSDEAVFQRRALAVEKERAIAENELQNRIELARREQELIAEQGQNRRQEAAEEVAAERIEAEGRAERRRMDAGARADAIRQVEMARVEADEKRMAIYGGLPAHVLFGLAARDLGGNLERIEHLNLGGDGFGSLLTDLVQAGIRNLDSGEADAGAVERN